MYAIEVRVRERAAERFRDRKARIAATAQNGTSSRTLSTDRFSQRKYPHGVRELRLYHRHQYQTICGVAEKSRRADTRQTCGAASHARCVQAETETNCRRPVGKSCEACALVVLIYNKWSWDISCFTDMCANADVASFTGTWASSIVLHGHRRPGERQLWLT